MRSTENGRLVLAVLLTTTMMGVALGCQKGREVKSLSYDIEREKNALAAEAAEEEAARLSANRKSASLKTSDLKAGKKTVPQETNTKAKARRPASLPGSVTNHDKFVYIVQLGAFRVKENAERMQLKLKADGYPVIMQPLNHSKNGELFVVRLEPTPSRAEAQSMMKSISEKASISAQLIARPENE